MREIMLICESDPKQWSTSVSQHVTAEVWVLTWDVERPRDTMKSVNGHVITLAAKLDAEKLRSQSR